LQETADSQDIANFSVKIELKFLIKSTKEDIMTFLKWVLDGHEDQDTSHIHQLTDYETSENRDADVPMLNPLMLSTERDSNSCASDPQATAQPRLRNDDLGHRMDIDTSQSCESDASNEQAGRKCGGF
jgi:hypothetical protein